jgi:uncharacterized glyoxalase superfamily protein PhnB
MKHPSFIRRVTFTILFGIIISCSSFAQVTNEKSDNNKPYEIRFEHLAFNVLDPVKVSKWYQENLGLKVVRQGGEPTYTTFISDQGGNMMFEFFYNKDYPVQDLSKWDCTSIHMAFICEDVEKIKEKLVSNGATVGIDIKKTDSGDEVLTLRDPWGLPIQFVKRVNKMLNHDGFYFEHLAFNLSDSRVKAKWFTENLGMIVKRDGKAPSYGMFISDAGENMMLELYQQKDYPVIGFDSISHMTIHLAFMTNDIEAVKEKLLSAGAKVVEDITKTAAGDFVLMMRDPFGMPVQFVKRANPMVN